MRRYVTHRALLVIPTLFLVSVGMFVILRVLPGDVTAAILGGEGEALQPELVASLREEMGLDEPLPVQYGKWVWSMVNGEFGGRSILTGEPIIDLVTRQLPVTVQLVVYSILLAGVVAVPLGLVAATRKGRIPDVAVRLLSALGSAVPGFWVALVILLFLVLSFGWSPPLVYSHIWENPVEHIQMMALPTLVLAWGYGAHIARITRSGLLDAERESYTLTARAKGLTPSDVLVRHGLRPTWIPVVTMAGLQLGTLFGAVVIMESVFGLPGVGRGLVEAVGARDYPVVQSLTLILVSVVLILNLIIDLVYSIADPRITSDG